ncbi:MAG: MBL fold metallo-hydrolase [Tannerella sp.]|jgi:glyoxylase-like metal-dependent hydrolase (beta-lactamase superfamily II)|nr:MBL fold metallo-hydrolase [Tannerella sp.]
MKKKNLSITLLMLGFAITNFSIMAQNEKNVFTTKVGNVKISTLTESQGEGDAKILIGATDEQIAKYLSDNKFPIATNSFLVQKNGQNILVDAGYGTKLFDNLQSLGVTPEQVNFILLTHMHGDHIGGLLRDGKKVFPNADLMLSREEYDYWYADKNEAQKKVLDVYKDNLILFDDKEFDEMGEDMIPGIECIAAYGHTPGHTAFLISDGNDKLLIWGDLTHAMKIQMPCPEVAMTYDVDPDMAIKARKKVLEYVAKHKIPIAGMHVPYPAIGNVTSNNSGGYIFESVK